jgi:MFS superfamily sulfate permease-like transporter
MGVECVYKSQSEAAGSYVPMAVVAAVVAVVVTEVVEKSFLSCLDDRV